MNKDKAASLLAQGLSPSSVASICGVTPAYLSQLAKDEAFKELIASKMPEAAVKPDDEIITNKYTAMEHKLLNAMENAIVNADLSEITHALKVVGDRQEKRASRLIAPAVAEAGRSVQVVQISMPVLPMPTITLNETKQVIAIDNKPMSPMASSAVQNLFARKRAEREAAATANEVSTTLETIPLTEASIPLTTNRTLPEDL